MAATSAAMAITLTMWLIPAPKAAAYNLNGCKFSTRNLLYGHTTVSGYQAIVDAAASRWSNSTDVNFTYVYGSVALGINPVVSNYGNNGLSGWVVLCSGGKRTSEAVYLNRYYLDTYSSAKKKGVATHEFGHALGLAHTNNNTVMYPTDAGRTQYSPVQDDINGINSLY
jgi:matrixin